MQKTVSTTPVLLPANDVLVQNLGPGVLYLSDDSASPSTTGIEVAVGASAVFVSSAGLTDVWAVATGGDADVRYLEGAAAVYPPT